MPPKKKKEKEKESKSKTVTQVEKEDEKTKSDVASEISQPGMEQVKKEEVKAENIIQTSKSEAIKDMKAGEQKFNQTQTNDGSTKLKDEKVIATTAPKVPMSSSTIKELGSSIVTAEGILNVEKQLSDANKVVTSAKEIIHPTELQTRELVEAISSNSNQPFAGVGVIADYKSTIRILPKRSKFPCYWTFDTVNLLSSRKQIFRYTIKIDSFDDRFSFRKARMVLNSRIIEAYDGIFQDVSKVQNTFLGSGRMTDPSSAGLALSPDRLSDLLESEVNDVRRYFKHNVLVKDVIDRNGDLVPYVKEMNAFVERREHELILELQRSWSQFILPNGINIKREFFSELVSQSKYRYMPPLPATLKTDWLYVVHDSNKINSPFRYMMDRNIIMPEFIRNMVSQIVDQTIALPTISETAVVKQITQALNINTNTISPLNDVPTRISPALGSEYQRNLYNVLLNRKWTEFFIPLEFNTVEGYSYDFSVVMDCFGCKLFTDMQEWGPSEIIKIDNYLYVNFILKWAAIVKATNPYIPTQSELNALQRNFLTEYLSRNLAFPMIAGGANMVNALRNFLLTTPQGGGWQSARGIGSVPITSIPHYQRFMNDRDCRYSYYSGVFSQMEDECLQMTYFKEFSSLLMGVNFVNVAVAVRLSDRYIGMFEFFKTLASKQSARIYHTNCRLRDMSLLSIVDPLRVQQIQSDPRRHKIKYPMWGAISAVALIDHYKMGELSIDPKWIEVGWRFHEFLDELCSAVQFVSELKNLEILSRSSLLLLAMEMVPDTYGFKSFFTKNIVGQPHFEILSFPHPTTTFYLERTKAAYKFIDSMIGHMGYVEEFYFSPYGMVGSTNDVYLLYYPEEFLNIQQTITYDQLKEAVYNDITGMVKRARLNDEGIRFIMPIILKEVEMKDMDAKDVVPFSFSGGLSPLKLEYINWYYQYKDDYVNSMHPLIAFNYTPRFFIKNIYEPNQRGRLLDIVTTQFSRSYNVYLPEWQQYTTIEFAKQNSG